MGWRQDWRTATPMLIIGVIAFSFGDLLFGIDTAAFSALQVLPSWLQEFGAYTEERGYHNPTTRTSIMNSVVFVGSFFGCAIFEPICERWGYKITIYCAAAVQVVAVIVELTAKSWEVFTVGRVLGYIGVGLVENASPGYCSEVSPAALRGFMSGSMTVLVTIGNVIGVSVAVPFVTETRRIGWIIPVAIQFIPAIGIIAMVPFCPESPRWLVSKGRDEEALRSLNRLRRKEEAVSGGNVAELDAIRQEIQYVRSIEQGRWVDLFNAKYRKRTFIVTGLFFWYQTTGGQFANVYGPTFYRQLGFVGELLLVYQTIGQSVGVIASIIAILLIDKIGRRPPVLFGACLLFVCNIIIGSFGPRSNLTNTQEGVVIASIMLLLSGLKLSFQCSAFLLASEVGGNRMRKKFMGFGTTVDVIFRLVFIMVVPYIMNTNPGLGMGPRFGFVMAFFAGISIFFVYFLMPETMGRQLEEMDELFAMKLWPWQWRKAVTTGVGHQVAEAHHADGDVEKSGNGEKQLGEAVHDENRETATIEDGARARA